MTNVKDLLKIVKPDRRQKHPFDYWLRRDFLQYCKKYNYRANPKGRKHVHWAVLYNHYLLRKEEQVKKFRVIIEPKIFLELVRYYYPTKDKRRERFLLKTSARIGHLRIKNAKEKISALKE